MNRLNIRPRPQRNFPLSTEGLDFEQLQIMQAAEMAKFAGGNCILSGCTVSGTTVSVGTVIINDEILPFIGGTLQTKIRIVETKSSITAGSETYDEAYIRRHAEFGSNLNDVDTFLWADFAPTPTLRSLVEESATKEELQDLMDLVMPRGGIIMWSGSVENLPNGFALCDGSIQGEFGVVPDLRGRFIVGYDSRTANSPETAPGVGVKNYAKLKNTGGLTSVTLGATQMPTHTHRLVANAGVSDANSNLMDHRPDGTIGKARETAGNLSYRLVSLDITPTIKPTLGLSSETGGSQAHENRPDYYVLAFIIKIV